MKKQLLFLISVILFFSFAAAGQQNPKAANKDTESKKDKTGLSKETEELEKFSKDALRAVYKLSQAPIKELTKTRDVREEAEKYFQAFINRDAAAILGYQPPFRVKQDEEANKFLKEIFKDFPGNNSNQPGSRLDEMKSALADMNKNTFQYNSVKIGEITETGILEGKDAPKERIFAVVKYTADVYIKGEKDVVNGNIVGYTDGKKWYFVDRAGISEKVLTWLGKDSPTEKQ